MTEEKTKIEEPELQGSKKKGSLKVDKLPKLGSVKSRIAAVIGVPLLFVFGLYGYQYFSTPANIRRPVVDHYHFRTQISVDGVDVDFSEDRFQEEYDSGTCSADLPTTPVHFHDGVGQMTHIHWRGVTGGQFLKYYGWSFIGGSDDSLGRRFDKGLTNVEQVGIRGNVLPKVDSDNNYHVYVGDENGYEQKEWSDFLEMDLEEFFGVKSKLNQGDDSSFNPLEIFFGKSVSAHGEIDDGHVEVTEPGSGAGEEARLTQLNNLIGNVVIFVQDEEPSADEVAAKFNNLLPLTDSTCGG